MGWSSWFKGSDNESYKEKHTSNSDGGSKSEYLSTHGGNKNHHTHTVVQKDSSGRSRSAHHNPAKRK